MLNLVLNGTNTITTGNVTDAKECYGIYLSMNDTLKISGTGTLKVTAGIAMDDSMGILEATAGKETICKIKRIFHYASGKKATCKVTVK